MRTGLPQGGAASRGPRVLRRTMPVLAFAAAALVGACQSNDVVTGSLPDDGYRTRYPIVLAEAPEYLDIPVGMGSAGLSADTRDSVRAFALDAAHRSTGSLVILVPSGSGNEATAAYLARDIRRIALDAGLNGGLVETRPYRVGDPRAAAPIRLSFSRIKAVSPPCGRWTGSILPSRSNDDDGAEFGCSNQANLAAMVENPNDLITPRTETPVPAWRRWWILDKYGKGEVPSGSYDSGSTSASSAASGG